MMPPIFMVGAKRPFRIERIIHRGGGEKAHDMRQRESGATAHEPLEQQDIDGYAKQPRQRQNGRRCRGNRAAGQCHQALQIGPLMSQG